MLNFWAARRGVAMLNIWAGSRGVAMSNICASFKRGVAMSYCWIRARTPGNSLSLVGQLRDLLMRGTPRGLLALDLVGVVVARLEYPDVPELAISNVAAPLARGIGGGLPALDCDWALDKAGVLAARLDAPEGPKRANIIVLGSPTVGNAEFCTTPAGNVVVGARADDTGFSAGSNMGLDLKHACISADISMQASCGASCGLNM